MALYSLPAVAPGGRPRPARQRHPGRQLRRHGLRRRHPVGPGLARHGAPVRRGSGDPGGAARRRRHAGVGGAWFRRHRPGPGRRCAGHRLRRRRPRQHPSAGAANAATGVQPGHVAAPDRRAARRRAGRADPAAAGPGDWLARRPAGRTGAGPAADRADGDPAPALGQRPRATAGACSAARCCSPSRCCRRPRFRRLSVAAFRLCRPRTLPGRVHDRATDHGGGPEPGAGRADPGRLPDRRLGQPPDLGLDRRPVPDTGADPGGAWRWAWRSRRC